MAEIPSDIASSAAQAASKARDVAKVRDSHNTGRAQAGKRHIEAIDDAGSMVDTEDADARVFAEAEGSGSQGRAPDEAEVEETAEKPPNEGVTRDDDGQLHLDLEA